MSADSCQKQTRALDEKDWPSVVQIDAKAFGAHRPELLRRLGQESRRACVWPAAGQVLGFGFLRAGADSDYLGPLACLTAEASAILVPELLAGPAAVSLTWDIPDHNESAKTAAQMFGFKPVRPLTRMRLGPPADALQPSALFGIADPAVG